MSKLRSIGKVALAVTLLGGGSAALLDGGVASADTIQCRNRGIGARVIDGDVNVPKGAGCILRGTRVEGNVFVRAGAKVQLVGARVDGNVQGTSSRNVIVRGRSVVDGDVQVNNGRRGNTVKLSRVNGNIQVKNNRGLTKVVRSTIAGDVQLFSNPGGFAVSRNRIDGNLQCKNNGTPRRGDHNIVQGNKEGQCRNR